MYLPGPDSRIFSAAHREGLVSETVENQRLQAGMSQEIKLQDPRQDRFRVPGMARQHRDGLGERDCKTCVTAISISF